MVQFNAVVTETDLHTETGDHHFPVRWIVRRRAGGHERIVFALQFSPTCANLRIAAKAVRAQPQKFRLQLIFIDCHRDATRRAIRQKNQFPRGPPCRVLIMELDLNFRFMYFGWNCLQHEERMMPSIRTTERRQPLQAASTRHQ